MIPVCSNSRLDQKLPVRPGLLWFCLFAQNGTLVASCLHLQKVRSCLGTPGVGDLARKTAQLSEANSCSKRAVCVWCTYSRSALSPAARAFSRTLALSHALFSQSVALPGSCSHYNDIEIRAIICCTTLVERSPYLHATFALCLPFYVYLPFLAVWLSRALDLHKCAKCVCVGVYACKCVCACM